MLLHKISKMIKTWANFIFYNKQLCRLEDIDLVNKTVFIQCSGIVTSLIKVKLEDIIRDEVILYNLSSTQAAWVGYYYGINHGEIIQNNVSKNHTTAYSVETQSSDEFEILMLDRKGNLLYINKANNKNFVSSPLSILNSKKILNKFSPPQACYVGILAGLNISKNTHKNKKNKPHFTVVNN